LRVAERDRIFYVYDTLSNLAAYNLNHHRLLLTNMAKRSRYFIANPGKIDSPGETDKTSEFGFRHFEGAAAGALIIGERPRNSEFDRIFHWKDALIDLPFDGENIGEIMRELDKQPERQIAARDIWFDAAAPRLGVLMGTRRTRYVTCRVSSWREKRG
jgi:hypothetical protein